MIRKKVIAYLRLSKEDGDDIESTSISNQRKIIQDYADKNGIIIDEWIIDDGVSGITLDRPGFNKIKKMLNDGIQCTIIAKDLSRLGRHSAKVQLFIENAAEMGSRVITLAENCDTDVEDSDEFIGIHTWVNEKMIRDCSKKIKKSLKAIQKEGNILGNIPYGYIKDETKKHVYYVDEEVAPYVQLMFQLYIEGNGIRKVARILTERNIPTPSAIAKMRAEQQGKVYKRQYSHRWEAGCINRMLHNDFYIGTLTLNKTKRKTINGRSVRQDKADMFVFPNAHPAIIDKATWNLVQEISEDRNKFYYRGMKDQKRKNIYAGKLICADCGKHLTSAGGADGNTRYVCKTYNIHGTSQCASHAVSEKEISYVLLDYLEYCRDNLGDIIEDLDGIIAAQMESKINTDNNIENLNNRFKDTKKSIEVLIEQKMRETMKNPAMTEMIDKMYDEMLNDKYKELQIIEQQIYDQQQIATNEVELKDNLNSALSLMNSILESQELTKKQVLLLIDKIIVHENTEIDFYLKGDLHKLCSGYFKVNGSKLAIIKRQMYDYIIEHPDKFIAGEMTVYIRNNGTKLTLKTVSKIINEELIANGVVKMNPGSRGFKLIGTQEELKSILIPNTVSGISRCIRHNNDIYDVLISIGNWIDSISTKNKKCLF